ncbi:MAG: hypothetical protein ACJ8F1_12930 [Polyangia bacterium]
MLTPRSRFRSLGAVLAVLTTLSFGAGPAFARTKKKHPKHAPAAHHAKGHQTTQPATEEPAEPATAEPAGESAPTEQPAPGAQEENDRDSASEASGESASPRKPTRHPSDENENEGEKDEASDTTGPRQPPALRGGVGFGALYRRLTWTGAHSSGLSGYALSPGPELGGWLEVYPGAFVDRGFGANIGAVLSFNRGFGMSSTSGSGLKADVIFEDFLLGLKMRFPLGAFVPHVAAGYGGQVFLFSPRLPEVPSVFYAFVRLAAGLRVQIANAIDAEVEAAYLAVVNPGTQAGYIGAPEYFPGLGAYGLEAAGSLGVRVTSVFGLRAGVDFRQYALDLSHATGMLMANQASDRYVTIWGGLEIVLDGAGSGAEKPRSDNKPPAPPVNPAD